MSLFKIGAVLDIFLDERNSGAPEYEAIVTRIMLYRVPYGGPEEGHYQLAMQRVWETDKWFCRDWNIKAIGRLVFKRRLSLEEMLIHEYEQVRIAGAKRYEKEAQDKARDSRIRRCSSLS